MDEHIRITVETSKLWRFLSINMDYTMTMLSKKLHTTDFIWLFAFLIKFYI